MGIFSSWQPRYEEAGIAVFPVHGDEKRPAVGNYLTAGIPASRQWAAKFTEADALGIACGSRNRLTVLDIDEPDESLLADAMNLLGQSPIVIRTASGKFHAWYRWNGEKRRGHSQSPLPGRKIDILGAGMVIAPPSKAPKGEYQFIAGSLNDLPSLPVLRLGRKPASSASAVAVTAQAGERNNAIFRALLSAARSCDGFESLLRIAREMNNSSGLSSPLPDDELLRVVASAWSYQERGCNWAGSGRRMVMTHEEYDVLQLQGSDALALFMRLRRVHHERETFCVANAMAAAMPDGAWNLKRFVAARNALLGVGALEVFKPQTGTAPAIYRFGEFRPPVFEGGSRGAV